MQNIASYIDFLKQREERAIHAKAALARAYAAAGDKRATVTALAVLVRIDDYRAVLRRLTPQQP